MFCLLNANRAGPAQITHFVVSDLDRNTVSSDLFIEPQTNRIYHLYPMQTEKSQPEGKQIMLETRFTEFLTLSIDPRVEISGSTLESDV